VGFKIYVENNMPQLAQILKKIKRKTINKIKTKKQQKQLKRYGKEALEKIDLAFKELNKTYFLVYGTLLGAYRDKDFISHDIDIDIGAFFHEYSKDIEKILQKYGFIKKHEFLVDDGKFAIEETYIYKKIHIDIFYFKLIDDNLVGYIFSNEPGLSWDKTIQKYGGLLIREECSTYYGIDKINFLGKKFNILKKPEKHLEYFYGKNFMIPDANWSPQKVKAVKFLKDKIAVMKKK
jgi:hypothetical protein